MSRSWFLKAHWKLPLAWPVPELWLPAKRNWSNLSKVVKILRHIYSLLYT